MRAVSEAKHDTKPSPWVWVGLIVLPIVVFFGALSIGRYPVSIPELGGTLYAQVTGEDMTTAQLALVRVRLPRVLIAMMVGAAFAMSGAVF